MGYSDDIAARRAVFESALKADGMRMTHQRLEVIAELAASGEHPSVEDVFRAVRVRVPTISLDTVYRTLATLADKGLIERLSIPGAARFDPDMGSHHHFVCTRCGLVRDIVDPALDAVRAEDATAVFGTVETVDIHLKGICRSCQHGGA